MRLRVVQVILTTAAVITFAVAAPLVITQQDTKGKSTAKGQMKEGGKEVDKAGKSLGHNVRHRRIVRGGKHFGKHIGYAGRHVGRGTKHAVKKAVRANYAGNGCIEVCQEKNRAEVRACNYPEKEPEALRQCLATARNNFDACKQGCGK